MYISTPNKFWKPRNIEIMYYSHAICVEACHQAWVGIEKGG